MSGHADGFDFLNLEILSEFFRQFDVWCVEKLTFLSIIGTFCLECDPDESHSHLGLCIIMSNMLENDHPAV